MKFTLEIRMGVPSPVWYENDDIKICVGEVAVAVMSGHYQFHFNSTAARLKPDAHVELRKFGAEQAAVLKLTERMLK